MKPYPVEIHIHSPARFDRVQIPLRLALSLVIGFLGISLGWIGCALYLVLPALAAAFISSRGPDGYLDDAAPTLSRLLAWLIGFHAYMFLVTDRFPVASASAELRMAVHPTGRPTVGAALLRLLTSIPAALLLAVLLAIATLFALIGAISVLIARSQPLALLRFQRAVVSYAARLAGYHAALVDSYPPFTLDSDDDRLPGQLPTGA